jgi:hypothetical protein
LSCLQIVQNLNIHGLVVLSSWASKMSKGTTKLTSYMWSPCLLSKCRWNNQWFYTPNLDPSCTQCTSSIACFGESFPWSSSWIANLALIKITSCYKMDVNIAQKNENIHYT